MSRLTELQKIPVDRKFVSLVTKRLHGITLFYFCLYLVCSRLIPQIIVIQTIVRIAVAIMSLSELRDKQERKKVRCYNLDGCSKLLILVSRNIFNFFKRNLFHHYYCYYHHYAIIGKNATNTDTISGYFVSISM